MTDYSEDTLEQLASNLADTEDTIKMLYETRDELRYEIVGRLRAEYPEEWKRVVEDRLANSFAVGSVTVEMPSRQYDPALLARVLTEDEISVIVKEEVVIKQVIDGRKLQPLWKDAARAKQLATAVIPAAPKVKVK